MKNLISSLTFLILCTGSIHSQDTGLQIDKNSFLGGLEGAHLILFEAEDDYARLRMTNSLFDASTNNRYWDIAGRIGVNSSGLEDRLNFYLRGFGDILSLRGNGRVGIGTISPAATLDVIGKIKIGDDGSSPAAGALRFNSTTSEFEGYDGTKWTNLSQSCACPYVVDPFTESTSSNFEILSGARLRITIDFSHRMAIETFEYGTNVVVWGTNGNSASGTFTWANANTSLIIETDDAWTDFVSNCFDGFNLSIVGSGSSSVKGENDNLFDGDRDGCCGGDYAIHFQLLC